ncbi:MAG: TRAP transporter small permease [Candidatus Competibacterales bacterium]
MALHGLLSRLDRHFEEVLCTLCLAVMASSVMLQVVLRFFFASATPWAQETAVYGMIFAVYFGASLAVRERAHIRITLLINALPRPLQVSCVVLADALWFGFIVFMVVQTSLYTQLLFEVTYITPGLGIEQRWVQLVLPLALVLTLFRLLQVYWQWGRAGWRGLPL